MLRILRPISRQPLTRCFTSLPRDAGTYNVRQVRIGRPWLGRKRINKIAMGTLSTFVALQCLAALLMWLGYEVEVDENGMEKLKKPGDAADVDEQDEGDEELAFFIPIGFPRPQPPHYYKYTDPEWQAFTKAMKNQDELRQLQSMVARDTLRILAKHPPAQRLLGQKVVSLTHNWDVNVPYSAPIQYVQPGYGGTTGKKPRGGRVLDAEAGASILATMHPVLVFNFAWAGAAAALGSLFPNSLAHPPPLVHLPSPRDYEGPVTRKGIEASASPKPGPPSEAPQPPSMAGEEPPEADPEEAAEQAAAADGAVPAVERFRLRFLPWVPAWAAPGPGAGAGAGLPAFAKAFRAGFVGARHNWLLPTQVQPRRGEMQLHGEIFVTGTAGFCSADVLVNYNPAAHSANIVWVALRSGKPVHQRPGPPG